MKRILFVILSIPIISLAQPKGTNMIIVHGVTLSQIDDSLNAKGFEIATIEGESLTTRPKQYYSVEDDKNKDHASIIITVKKSGNDVVISAMYTYEESETKILGQHSQTGKPAKVENGYTKGSFMRRAFDYMNAFAKSISSDISYARQ